MDVQHTSNSVQKVQPPAPKQPRSSIQRIVIPTSLFLLGIVFGMFALLTAALYISGERQVLPTTKPPQGSDIVVQVGIRYITHLVERGLQASGLVNASNVTVTMVQGDQMTINGDEQLFLGVIRPFSIVVQPTISSCQLEMHVIKADLAGISRTGFVANFEGRVNQELRAKSGSLPGGFEYCKTSVRTDPQEGLFITFSAKPL